MLAYRGALVVEIIEKMVSFGNNYRGENLAKSERVREKMLTIIINHTEIA